MIHHGDLFNVLPTFAAESIDACVTDPPYGIGLSGKKWGTFSPTKARASKAFMVGHGDKGRKNSPNPNLRGRRQSPAMSPSQIEYDRSIAGQRGFQEWCEKWARQVFRVLKPGGYLLVCGAPRSFHRMASGLEDAGFEIRDCLSWLCGQGFPKSLNFADGWGTGLKPSWEPIIVARRPCDRTITKNKARHGTGAININGCRLSAAGAARGRWPANSLFDEAAASILDGGSAGASRFFFVAKPSASEKNRGIYNGPNTHPTVKPVELMRWLVRLVVPKGGRCLDPFTGSGTTGVACVAEGFDFVGVEREADYVDLSRRRVLHATRSLPSRSA